MKENISFLNEFKTEIAQWLEHPSVSASPEVMAKILLGVELSIELIKTNSKISEEDKHIFEGGAYLARYFDGWGESYFDKYSKMVNYIKINHY